MKIIPKTMTEWMILLMHASEVFILTVFVAFLSGIRFQYVSGNSGEKIILLHCVVTLFLLGLSIIMKIKGQAASLTGFAFVIIGVTAAWALLPTLMM